tara:strand:+ start:706 stop:882 length:177 start_codon:yes stop_codon:yes gene_type:complete
MGIKTKLAKGPNPLSMRKKTGAMTARDSPGSIKKKRLRKGKRSKVLSSAKKEGVVVAV